MRSDAGDMAGSMSEELAYFSVSLNLANTPPEVIQYAKILVLDLLGAALAGVETEEGRAIRKAARWFGPKQGSARLWGTARRSSPATAALVNGTVAHAQELDDFGGADHSGAVVIPAVVAVCEGSALLDGTRFLEAVVVGYEIAFRVLDAAGGYRLHNNRGWHSTGTCGSFGAAAAAAKILDLGVQETKWALGLAGSFTGGTWAFLVDGAMSKRYHPGRAAEIGVTSAYLARAGFIGPSQVFEAPWGGFFPTYAPDTARPAQLLADLGHDFRILKSGIKPYACCRGAHCALDAILALKREDGLTSEQVSRIRVRCIPDNLRTLGVKQPQTRLAAQMSLPYSMAVALRTGRAMLEEYEEPWFSDPTIRHLAEVIDLEGDPSLPNESAPYVTVETVDGRRLTSHVPVGRGDPQNPLSTSEVIAKYDSLARRLLDGERAEALKAAVLAIEEPGRLAEALRLLQLPGRLKGKPSQPALPRVSRA